MDDLLSPGEAGCRFDAILSNPGDEIQSKAISVQRGEHASSLVAPASNRRGPPHVTGQMEKAKPADKLFFEFGHLGVIIRYSRWRQKPRPRPGGIMRFYWLRRVKQPRYSGSYDDEHKWSLPGVHCPVCHAIWSDGSDAYPSANLSGLPEQEKYSARLEEDYAEFERPREQIRRFVPPGAHLGQAPECGGPTRSRGSCQPGSGRALRKVVQ